MPEATPSVTILLDSAAPAVRWAAEHLAHALTEAGVPATVQEREGGDATGAGGDGTLVLVADGSSDAARRALADAGIMVPDVAEALVLAPVTVQGRPATLASGSDERGVVYATLELADRVRYAQDLQAARQALHLAAPEVARPGNRLRSVMRLFTSDVEDLPWFHDRTFWPEYLAEMVTQRFNRFQLAFGIGFDFARNMRDTYFYFLYPFLFDVPGYDVHASGVTAEEQSRNLESLRFIAQEAKRHGLHFQVGVWANVYIFEDSPDVNYRIEGLTPETHAPYCRDALKLLLERVPEIDGITLRIHGESGVPEGNYDFWRTLLSGVAECGRTVEVDMHAKGIDEAMIQVGRETGQPLVVSPKFWAEHLGLPYHQAEIRALEQPGQPTGQHARLMALSIGSRRFTRYGYADLLREDRDYGVLFRIWPGTNRLLLWGDPVTGRAYGRAFSIGGADGVEVFEPLSFSGRRGSGLPEGRNPYADRSLWPDPERPHDAWQKYRYEYRLWGRLLYDPDADADQWRRYTRAQLGPAAPQLETALSWASRILPLVTTAHHPSAANNNYWPEIYTNMPIVDDPASGTGAAAGGPEVRRHPYGDTPNPKRFGTVSPLDPELFTTIEESVDEALAGQRSARYTPLEVAAWLVSCGDQAEQSLGEAEARAGDARSGEFRRWALDIRIEVALGRFYAEKLRAGVHYALYQRTDDRAALTEAVACYRAARAAWVAAAELGKGAYKPDLTFGPEAQLRGHWADRLPAIDGDLNAMVAQLERAQPTRGTAAAAAREKLNASRPQVQVGHTAPTGFVPGQPLTLQATLPAGSPAGQSISEVVLHYRHLNQGERWRTAALERRDTTYRGQVPADYTHSPYPLQYYLEVRETPERAALWPGLGADLSTQPYVVVRAPSE